MTEKRPPLQPLPGETFFSYRIRAGYKRARHLAHASGTDTAVMSHLENGKHTYRRAILKLAAFFGITEVQMRDLVENSVRVNPR